MGSMRFGCEPAVMQADISSAGEPSLVTLPLKSLMATAFSGASALGFQSPLEMMPEAPSPSISLTVSSDQAMSSRTGLSSNEGAQGFPANDKKASSGRLNSQVGSLVMLFTDILSRPSFWQLTNSSGRVVN